MTSNETETPVARDFEAALIAAEALFNHAVVVYGDLLARLETGGAMSWADADKAAKAVPAALQTVLNLRVKIHEERQKQPGAVPDGALDLDQARAEVGRLLDRLRAAGEAG